MPGPKILDSVPPIVDRLAFHLGRDVARPLPQKPRPDSIRPKNISKLNPLALSGPEPAVDDEPRRCRSLRRALHLGDDFLRDRSRSLLIARKMHRVFRAALRRRTHVRRVTKHLRQRNASPDHLRTCAALHALDATTARTQIAHDRARVIFRGYDFDRHHRLKQYWRSLARRL